MALQLVNVVLESGRPLEDLAASFHRYPQVLLNVRVVTPERWEDNPEILAELISSAASSAGRWCRRLQRHRDGI